MPLDPMPKHLPECAKDIVVTEEFRYLGIQVTPDPTQYLDLNMAPLLRKFKLKCAAWIKLFLSVTGRVNLIKMVWAPQLLYIFHNSPIWITHNRFTQKDTQFRDLIWGN